MASRNANPFYIEPNQQTDEVDEWAWEDDTDDLEELLGDGDDSQYPMQPAKRSGEMPLQNLARRPGGSRLLYMAVALVVLILLISVLTPSSRGNDPPIDESLTSRDSVPFEQPRIVVLGERYSGRRWLENSLRICFPNATVSSSLTRAGIFFQDDPKDPDIHVVAVAVNAYSWVESMRTHPLYMPNHAEISSWSDFLAKEWTTKRPERDLQMEGRRGKVCQMDFTFNEVVSCVESPEDDPATNPIYEMKRDGSGTPFESVLALRAAKFRNHVEEMQGWVKTVNAIKYESLVANNTDHHGNAVPGIIDLLELLASAMGMEWSCTPARAEAVRTNSSPSTDFVKYMNEHVDWDAERLFGYNPIDVSTISDNAVDDDNQASDKDDDQSDHNGEPKTVPANENLRTIPPNEQKTSSQDDHETGSNGTGDDGTSDDDASPEIPYEQLMGQAGAPSSSIAEHETPTPGIVPVVTKSPEKTSSIAPTPQSHRSSSPPSNKSQMQMSAAPSILGSVLSKPKVTPKSPSLSPKSSGLPSKPLNTQEKSGEHKVVVASSDDDYDATKVYDSDASDDDSGDDHVGVEDGGEAGDEADDDDGDKNDDEIEEASISQLPLPKLSPQPSPYPTLQVSTKPSAHPTVVLTRKPTVFKTPEPSAAPSATITDSPQSDKSENGDDGIDDSANAGKTAADADGNEASDNPTDGSGKKKKTKHKHHSNGAVASRTDQPDIDSSGKGKKEEKHKSDQHSDAEESEKHPKHKKHSADDNSNKIEDESDEIES